MSEIKKKRYFFLDAIRGIAALAVVVQHILWFHSTRFEAFFSSVWSSGRFGVVAFFIVSGFIVPHSLEQKGSIKEFWIGRFFRLYPAYWFSLALIFLLAVFGVGSQNPVKAWIVNLTMMQEFVHVYDINVVTWTLGLEIALYAAITVAYALKFLNRTWFVSLALLTILCGASIILPAVFHIRFPAGAMSVFGSIIAGMAFYRWFAGQLKLRDAGIIIFLCLAVTIVSSIVNYSPVHVVGEGNSPTQFCAVFSAFTGYAFFAVMLWLKDVKFPRWVLWLGTVSYSLYLLHPVAGIMISHEGNPYLKDSMLLATSLALAWFGYTFVEVPSGKFAKRFLAPASK